MGNIGLVVLLRPK